MSPVEILACAVVAQFILLTIFVWKLKGVSDAYHTLAATKQIVLRDEELAGAIIEVKNSHDLLKREVGTIKTSLGIKQVFSVQ